MEILVMNIGKSSFKIADCQEKKWCQISAMNSPVFFLKKRLHNQNDYA